MANANKPSGLSPRMFLNGAKWNGAGRIYCIPDTDDTNPYAIGDPVVLAGDADVNGIPTITLATAGTGNPLLGAIVAGAGALNDGGMYGVPADSPTVIPATKTRNYYVLVADDPGIIFEVQEDSDAGSIAAASVGLNVNLIAGTNNGYQSTWQLDSSSVGTGATIQMKILRAERATDNALGTYCKWLCLINNHLFRGGVAGV